MAPPYYSSAIEMIKDSKIATDGALSGVAEKYLRQQQRGVRIFNGDLEVVYDNIDDRLERYPVFHDSSGRAVEIPEPGQLRQIWPVFKVLNGAEEAEQLYSTIQSGRPSDVSILIRAYPMIDSESGERWIVEESEEMRSSARAREPLNLLDAEVDRLIRLVAEHLDSSPTGEVLEFRLPNPHLNHCSELLNCQQADCPAHRDDLTWRCWDIPNTLCQLVESENQDPISKILYCNDCHVFQKACPDPITHLTENFNRLIAILQIKYQETLSAQNQLQEVHKLAMLGEVLAGMAHEIKNPLCIIGSRLDILALELDSLSEGEILEDLKVVANQAKRVQDLIDHLLKMGRPSASNCEEFPLNDLVRDTLPMVRKTLSDDKIALRLDLAPDLSPLFIDVKHVQQVLLNLILNARDELRNGGSIEVATRKSIYPAHLLSSSGATKSSRKDSQGIELIVRDSGKGVPVELREKIFEPFFSTKLDDGGIGLGLAVCRRTMGQLHGEIYLSPSGDRGAAFHLWFPVARPKSLS